MGREEALGGTGRGGEKSWASPAGRFDWLSIPAETAAPSPGTSGPSCNNYGETKEGWVPHCSPETFRARVRRKWKALEGAHLRAWGCSWSHLSYLMAPMLSVFRFLSPIYLSQGTVIKSSELPGLY